MIGKILSETPGRLRIATGRRQLSMEEADALEYYLSLQEGVKEVSVHERTGNAVIRYAHGRDAILRAWAQYQGPTQELKERMPVTDARRTRRDFEDRAALLVVRKTVKDFLLPLPVRAVLTSVAAVRYVAAGIRSLKSLKEKRLKVEVLDAVSVGVSVLRGDFRTAGNVMFLLELGYLLGEWTRRRSMGDLARSMSLNIDRVWLKTEDSEILVPVSSVKAGDILCVRQGSMIPLDGRVVAGEAMVNQASMTGESMPVRKSAGSLCYAGCVVEEGECEICVEQVSGSGRYDRIVKMIEESDRLKSAAESRALNLAEKLVPVSLGASALAALITRNATRAVSVLMVDFSCALRLCMPLSVMSAMRECGRRHIVVKGGKFLEAVADADTIVFDKTGTLTHSKPTVAGVLPFGGHDETEMLRIAACLEEHFPHSIANAVVAEAARRGIEHREMHSEVEYIVAHGIASAIEGKKAVIGSWHFVFEDEGVSVPADEEEKFNALPAEYSHLYLALDGVLAAVLSICDPLRGEVREVIRDLRALGVTNAVMMTGDSERTAAAVAARAGMNSFYAEVLPEDKARFVHRERESGHTVIMIGDGINDSPALSEADAGVAISSGAAIAREVADITVEADDLRELVYLKEVANALSGRIDRNYRFVMGFNSALIVLGILGILSPSMSALLHNASTLAVSLKSLTPLVPEDAGAGEDAAAGEAQIGGEPARLTA